MERVKSFRVESLTASPGGLWVWEFAILFEFFFFILILTCFAGE